MRYKESLIPCWHVCTFLTLFYILVSLKINWGCFMDFLFISVILLILITLCSKFFQAKQLVGSTLLVREEDRPELEEGEFYTPDLVGMRVILEESGELVGTVVNVFKSGASDLLQVMLDSSGNLANGNGRTESVVGDSARLVWVPFVEAIVPIVNMIKREMYISPPKGLLQLNLRADERSKKERRQLMEFD